MINRYRGLGATFALLLVSLLSLGAAQAEEQTLIKPDNARGVDASVDFRATSGYNWAAGVFAGRIRRAQTVNAALGWDINNNFRVFGNAVNLLDQRRFSIYGGSVNGRRVLGGLTTRF